MVRLVIKAVVWVVLLGYMMMWIMMPTSTYWNEWSPSIESHTKSTYFGSEGSTLLISTFPVLFVAVLGCLYLHLGTGMGPAKFHEKGERKNRFGATWRRPMLVKGPLGIVSAIEVTFLAMFVGLLGWYLGISLKKWFDDITPEDVMTYGAHHMWKARLGWAAWILGLVGNVSLTFLFFPVARGSSVLPLFGLTSEGSIKYHIWLGHMTMAIFTAHGIVYVIYWAVINKISEMAKWSKTSISNVAGEISLLAGLVLWATTFQRVRRKMFELFFYTHYLYIIFMLFFFLHVGISYSCIALPGFYLFVVDRYLRFLQSRQRVRSDNARVLPCETLELNFSKSVSLKYTPTSILFLNVPSISKLQWHPFTINSNCNLESDTLSVLIKGEGSWTKKLYQIVSSPNQVERLEVSVEGPYGPASTDFLRHDTLVMVSGGSGITPFISIIRELIFASSNQTCKTPQVLLISAFKNTSELAMLDLVLPLSGTQSTLSSLQLKIEAYVTREKQAANDHSKVIRTVWFKPDQKDSPASPILGPNSWLYLAAIISSSFIIFLIIIGIITRYYIYPTDHNTDSVFSLSWKTFLNLLVMCFSILGVASAAVIWNKRENAREANQIQNLDMPTPVQSPASQLYQANMELESVPYQRLAESTTVHYGERPDLKKLLFDLKGSSVGVLACGPKKLRQDVASICASGLATNLHFESISFSW